MFVIQNKIVARTEAQMYNYGFFCELVFYFFISIQSDVSRAARQIGGGEFCSRYTT